VINGLDLFSGIGGISLALSDWVKPTVYCEIDRYAQAVLISRISDGLLPAAPIFSDVRKLDGLPLRGLVDIIYGGFPCQDLSLAGLGKGLEGERSGLFFEILRLAKEVRPRFIFLENVPAIRTRGASLVCKELAACGYDLRWTTISAFDVGAPHKRERWFLLAHANNGDRGRLRNIFETDEIKVRSEIKYENETRESSDAGSYASDSDRKPIRTKQIKKSGSQDQAEPQYASWWQAQPDVGRVVDELPNRVDRIKCLGNGVVPLQVKAAFKELIGKL